jgi:hypothetical protein
VSRCRVLRPGRTYLPRARCSSGYSCSHAAERERISRASSRHRKTLAAIATTPTVMTNGSTGA